MKYRFKFIGLSMLAMIHSSPRIEYADNELVNIVPIGFSGEPINFVGDFRMQVKGKEFMAQSPENRAAQINRVLSFHNYGVGGAVRMPLNGIIIPCSDHINVNCVVTQGALEFRGESWPEGAYFYILNALPFNWRLHMYQTGQLSLENSLFTTGYIRESSPSAFRVCIEILNQSGQGIAEYPASFDGFDTELAAEMGMGVWETGLLCSAIRNSGLAWGHHYEAMEMELGKRVLHLKQHVLGGSCTINFLKLVFEGERKSYCKLMRAMGRRWTEIQFGRYRFLLGENHGLKPADLDEALRYLLHHLTTTRSFIEAYRRLGFKETWVEMFRFTHLARLFESGEVVHV